MVIVNGNDGSIVKMADSAKSITYQPRIIEYPIVGEISRNALLVKAERRGMKVISRARVQFPGLGV